MMSVSQSVQGAVLRADNKRYNCVVLVRSAESIEFLLRDALLEVDQRIQLTTAKWTTDAIVTEVTPSDGLCIVHCELV